MVLTMQIEPLVKRYFVEFDYSFWLDFVCYSLFISFFLRDSSHKLISQTES